MTFKYEETEEVGEEGDELYRHMYVILQTSICVRSQNLQDKVYLLFYIL